MFICSFAETPVWTLSAIMDVLGCDYVTEERAHTAMWMGLSGPPAFVDSVILENDSVMRCYLLHAHAHTSMLKKLFVNARNNVGD